VAKALGMDRSDERVRGLFPSEPMAGDEKYVRTILDAKEKPSLASPVGRRQVPVMRAELVKRGFTFGKAGAK
jgi:hypothetical protein